MKPVRTTNKGCRPHVQATREFDGHQLYARWEKPNVYVVYSYGVHWPLFANIDGQWYSNSDRYGNATSKQRGQAHPYGNVTELGRDGLIAAINKATRAAA